MSIEPITRLQHDESGAGDALGDFFDYFEKAKSKPLYIILGSQGSGTNLLSRILRSVFDFSVVHDRSLIFNAAVRVHKEQGQWRISREGRRVLHSLFPGFWRKRLATKNYHHQAKSYIGIHGYLDRADLSTAREFAYFFYAYHGWINNATHLGIKSDDIWERINYLSSLFPQRRYILLVRDPRDNALSIVNKPWGPCDVVSASFYLRRRLDAYTREVEAFPEQAFVTHYETLLTEPETFVDSFASFSGLAVPSDLTSRLGTLSIRSRNFNKWQKLPSETLATCEHVLAEPLKRFGYQLSGSYRDGSSAIGPMAFGYHFLRDVCHRISQKISGRCRHFIWP